MGEKEENSVKREEEGRGEVPEGKENNLGKEGEEGK